MTKKETSGLILKIDDHVSIHTDSNNYIVKYGQHYHYLDSLSACFEDIFEERIKVRLIENKKKDIAEIKKIHEETIEWLKKLFHNIENPKF